MKSILPTLFVIVAAVNALIPSQLDGCEYKKLGVDPWDDCEGACKSINCPLACNRIGSKDRPKYVVVGNYNGPIINTCSCICYLQ
ncbi:hypothetical protein PTNB85_01398 [Pyrenophora teres f. teres]|uniref:Uncharacterized protein n=1 Tax=Pyrenophora teres f. teres TaxID=97479 RepID=A0A6S6VS21_9PLEO|nr:hypothetical protein PTNB85_01398 [Pyrenophora teres f. teres]KAE8869658.1 hypothetical protein PTNB29_00002 [Pyrenophora teres f. teres]CAE7007070.1 hypothetical protein PTTW11_01493 [Pyrenophora teres f. teres]